MEYFWYVIAALGAGIGTGPSVIAVVLFLIRTAVLPASGDENAPDLE